VAKGTDNSYETLPARAAPIPACGQPATRRWCALAAISQRARHWKREIRRCRGRELGGRAKQLKKALEQAPDAIRAIVHEWLRVAFRSPLASDEQRLDPWVRATLDRRGTGGPERCPGLLGISQRGAFVAIHLCALSHDGKNGFTERE
jgi:hypothetical protein